VKRERLLLIIISIVLGVIPFFWMKQGEIDIGGDATRLYFYDPLHYLLSTLRYVILPVGLGAEENYFMFLPFVLLLSFLKLFLSPTLLITTFNSLKLVIGFLSMYLISEELLPKRNGKAAFLASVFCGIFYVFSPVLVRSAWDKAIMTHNQIFLNPLLFLMLFLYIKTDNFRYLLMSLLITFIFSANFSAGGAPPFFTFYPLTITFLLCYRFIILKKNLNIREILFAMILFFLVHAFHLVPTVVSLIHGSGASFSRAFTAGGMYNEGLRYFLESAKNITLTDNLLHLPQLIDFPFFFKGFMIFFPLLIILGVYFTSKESSIQHRKTFLLFCLFFLVAMFLDTANVTNIGFDMYALAFSIPGFSMFRNFYGQWAFVYIFFYCLIFSLSFYYVLEKVKQTKVQVIIFIFLISFLVVNAIPLISGDLIRIALNKGASREHHIPQEFDPKYEEVLTYIRNDVRGGRYISFPFTESFYQMLSGKNEGMYQGPSTISHLTGNMDIPGYQNLIPFSDVFLTLVKEKNNDAILNLFQIINIHSIFHNADSRILHDFPGTPYNHVRNYLPNSQSEYQRLIASLDIEKKKSFGEYYTIYQLNDDLYLPEIYAADTVKTYSNNISEREAMYSFLRQKKQSEKSVLLAREYQKFTKISSPKLSIQQINPTKYYVTVEQVSGPYVLIFSQSYNPAWKLYVADEMHKITGSATRYFNSDILQAANKNEWIDTNTFETVGKKTIGDKTHIPANQYANAWYITPKDIQGKKSYTLILEIDSQKYYYIALAISALAILVTVLVLIQNEYARKKK
jgi:hypothetical protein